MVKDPAEAAHPNNSNVSSALSETAGASLKIKIWGASSMHVYTRTQMHTYTPDTVEHRKEVQGKETQLLPYPFLSSH